MSQQKLRTLNEDWLKTRTWDLYAGNQVVTTLPQLLYVLRVAQASEDRQREAVRAMISRPAWLAAPAELKRDAERFLGETKVVFRTSVKDDNPPSTPYGIPQNASMGQPVDDELTEGGVPLEEKAYDPDEPRDEHGRWGSRGAVSDATITPIRPRDVTDLTDPSLSDGSIKPVDDESSLKNGDTRVPLGDSFTEDELKPFIGHTVRIDANGSWMDSLIGEVVKVEKGPFEGAGPDVTLKNTRFASGDINNIDPTEQAYGTTSWGKVTVDEESKAYQGGPGGIWPEPSTQTVEEREAVFTRLADQLARNGSWMNNGLWGSLEQANSGKTPGEFAAAQVAKYDEDSRHDAKDVMFKANLIRKLLDNPRDPEKLPKGRNEVQRDLAANARIYLNNAQRNAEWGADAVKVQAWFQELAKAQAADDIHGYESVAPPTLAREYKTDVETPDSANGYTRVDQVGPEMAKAFTAALEKEIRPDGTVDRLGDLAGSDFIKHDQVLAAGRQVAATIDNRDDVVEAKRAMDAASAQYGAASLRAHEAFMESNSNAYAYDRANAERDEADDAYSNAKTGYSNTLLRATIEEVGKVRPLAEPKDLKVRTASQELGDRAQQAAAVYPKDWIDHNSKMGPLSVEATDWDNGRGYHINNSIHLDPASDNNGTTAIHELMHQMEDAIPGIKALEAADWRSRTEGGTVKALTELQPSHGYKQGENAIPDKFADAYMGKLYPQTSGNIVRFASPAGRNSPFEIMSTAMGWMFGSAGSPSSAVGGRLVGIDPRSAVKADPDTRALVLGALTQL